MHTDSNALWQRLSTFAVAMVIASTLTPGEAEAQQPTTACYVPNVGAIYLIGEPGLPSACLDGSHVQITLAGGVSGRQIVTNATTVNAGTSTNLNAVCPTGKVAVGGGFDAVSFPGLSVYGSFPTDVNGTGDAWRLSLRNEGTFSITVTAFAVCAYEN